MGQLEDRRTIVQGLAAWAISLAGMGASEDDVRAQLVGVLQQVRAPDVGVVREAAVMVGRFPQPLDESPEEIERAAPMRELLGVPSAAQELADQLKARVAGAPGQRPGRGPGVTARAVVGPIGHAAGTPAPRAPSTRGRASALTCSNGDPAPHTGGRL